MKKLILICLLGTFGMSYSLTQFYEDYKEENYLRSCKDGLRIFSKHKNDEKFLTVYAFSCLKSDMIDRLAVPVTGLRSTKEARANASYFSAILLQKKLLYHSVVDGVDISGLNFPTTDFILSKVFTLYSDKKYEKKNGAYLLEGDGVTYKMYVEEGARFKKVVIEEYENGKLVKTHKYF